MTEEQLKKEIFARYGAVTRARGCFLYTKKGVRLTDMYQAGGRAILGWGGGDAFTRLKNVLNRGLTGSFISEFTFQIDKAVSELIESKRKVYFTSEKPVSGVLWEPWKENSANLSSEKVICVKPPLPWTDSIYMICVSEDAADFCPEKTISLPSPVIAGITRSVYDLIGAMKEREEKDWFLYDQVLCSYFERKGPYLEPKVAEEKYDDFVLFCLELGIIINPEYSGHSIVPFGADKGVFSKLKKDERGNSYAAG